MKQKTRCGRCLLPSTKKMLAILIASILFCFPVLAQERIITGIVTDANNVALPGVNVILKGTATGVVTDVNGNYSIKVPGNEAVISITYIGYKNQEITVGQQTSINITLEEDVQQMDEVVVVGYGTMKKKLSTGANAHVSSDEMDQKHSLRLEQSIQGLTSGVQVTANSGQPGTNFKVRIRGVGTVGNADPLYIVDGVPTGDIAYLNPSDIESVDILKDAASAAIYGAEAANGVVLITTKKGKVGEMKISYDGYYGVQNVTKNIDMLNTQDYSMLLDEGFINANPKYRTAKINGKSYPDNLPFLPALDNNNDIIYDSNGNIQLSSNYLDTVPRTNWQDYLFRKNAPIQNHSVNIDGGNEKSIYSASANYFSQDGIIGSHDQSSYQRMSVRLNSDNKLYKNVLTFGENITLAHTVSSGVGVGNIYGNTVRGFLNASPIFRPYDNTYLDNFGRSPNPAEGNPVGDLYYVNQNQTINNKVVGDMYLDLSPVTGLNLKTDLGVDVSINEYNKFTPVYNLSTLDQNTHSIAEMNLDRNFKYNWENTVTYNFTLNKNNITLLAGNTVREKTRYYAGGKSYDLIIPDLEHAILNNGTNDTLRTNYGTKEDETFLSYFGRINYNYNEKYLLSGVFRRDGSTKFGPNNRFGNFFSASGGWIVTQEDFFKLDGLDFLKIRASWGQNGNDNIPSFSYLSLISYTDKNYYFGNPESKSPGATPDVIPNPSVKWETATQTDIGFDTRFLKSFSFSFDWYNKIQKDWLVTIQVPELMGILNSSSYPTGNGGSVQNMGVEFALGYQKTAGDFTFGINCNLSYNKNKVRDIPTVDSIVHGESGVLFNGNDEFYRAQNGYPVGYFYGYKTAGIFQDTTQIINYAKNGKKIQPTAKPGDVIFQDINGDGTITTKDKTEIGNPWPKYTYGLSFDAGYKGFDLSIVLQGVYGNDIVDGTRPMNSFTANWTTDALNRWHGPGTSNSLPRITDGAESNLNWKRISDLWIQDGSYLKVRSINFGYDFAKILLKGTLKQCRLYFSVVNAFTFTKYKGYDPEIGYGDYDEKRYSNMSTGIDLGTYPQARQYLIGLNIKF
jgi:TonB-dependent starch-binding outer membrane protein SusC